MGCERNSMQIEPWYMFPVPTYRVNKHKDRGGGAGQRIKGCAMCVVLAGLPIGFVGSTLFEVVRYDLYIWRYRL
jgi:hypothetical protein